jgi:hypothetical protein
MDELIRGKKQRRDARIASPIPVLCQELGTSYDLNLAYDDGEFPGSRREIVAPRSTFKTQAFGNGEAFSGFESAFEVEPFCGTGWWWGCCRVHLVPDVE